MKKRFLHALLAGALAIGCMAPSVGALPVQDDFEVYADWKFDEGSIKSGSIKDKNLIFKDHSGNKNELRMNTYGDAKDYSQYVSFSKETMDKSTKGSLVFTGDSKNKIGADFITVDNAPINKETFEDGYTIEFLYKLPTTWTVADSWMGLLSRQGSAKSMDEPELGTMSVAVSNCKEIQFNTANKADNHTMDSAWSVSMDKGGVWYHIAITSDNETIRTYVNGAEAFRDYVSDDMVGLYADPQDGRFRVGSSYWDDLSKFAVGNFQRIRISEGALDRSEWLLSTPEDFAGDYGTNDYFKMKNDANYSMVFLPDTQNTIKFRPSIIEDSMNWLVQNQDYMNLSSVAHLGDIVQDPVAIDQWDNTLLFNILSDNGVKLLMQPGNHDDPALFDKYFGNASQYGKVSQDYVTRNAPSGRSAYMIHDGGSYKYMTLSVDIHSLDQDLPWVDQVLSTTNMPTIITSHDIQNCSDTAPSAIKLSKRGTQIWETVKKHNQVFMMVGGHSHGAGEEILINDAGNQVWSVLADYQFAYNGGNALYKFAEFDELNNKIYMSTFSPYVATLKEDEKSFFDVNYLTGDGNYFEYNINFKERFKGMEKSDWYTKTLGKFQDMLQKKDVEDFSLELMDTFMMLSQSR
ncbi:MAG: LamG-like jellyroll fold domain-containing protein [Cellulosilyticaceae bacterium]